MRDLYPTNPAVLVALGDTDANASHWSDASEVYLDVLDKDAHNVEAILGLAESLARQDRPQEAVDALCAAYRTAGSTPQLVSALRKLEASPKECVADVRQPIHGRRRATN
jgi:predicted Zn-dependent protease